MINNLTPHFKICKEQYKTIQTELKTLKQEFALKTPYQGICIFCGKLCSEKVCDLCKKNNFLSSEIFLLHKNDQFEREMRFLDRINLKTKHYEEYNFETRGSMYAIFDINNLFNEAKKKICFLCNKNENENLSLENKYEAFTDSFDIYNFNVIHKKQIYYFDTPQEYQPMKFRVSLKKLSLLNKEIFEVFENYKNKVINQNTIDFYKNRIQYKLKMIDEQIETNTANYKKAVEREQIDDVKAFKEIIDVLWENKEDLMKKQTDLDFDGKL